MPVYVWENVVMLPRLPYTSVVFMGLLCVYYVQALHMGDTFLCGLHFFQVDPKQQGNTTTHTEKQQQQQEKKYSHVTRTA